MAGRREPLTAGSRAGTWAGGVALALVLALVLGTLAAVALRAEKVLYLTDVAGILADVDEPSSLIRRTSVAELRSLVEDGALGGGMIPKVQACLSAVEAGVGSAHVLDGRIPHVLLLEILTDEGIGTMIARYAP